MRPSSSIFQTLLLDQKEGLVHSKNRANGNIVWRILQRYLHVTILLVMALTVSASSLPDQHSSSQDDTVCSSQEEEIISWIQMDDNHQLLHGDKKFDLFGWSVSLSKDSANDDGMILAVSAIDNDSYGSASGQVRVYRRGREEEEGELSLIGIINGEHSGDYAGYSVSLVMDERTGVPMVAVGSPDHDQRAGQVRVYRYNHRDETSSWNPMGQAIQGLQAGDGLGHIVKLSTQGRTTTLAVGAPHHKDDTGLVQAFRNYKNEANGEESWQQIGDNLVGDDVVGAQFGYSVAIKENILAVGAKNHPSTSTTTKTTKCFRKKVPIRI
jgi:hypothetical protein